MALRTTCALLLLLTGLQTAASMSTSSGLQCSAWPVGALHPVRAQLERVEAGIGCAAREGGAKETHVISVGRAPSKQVRVLLRPLVLSRALERTVILVLSSQHPVRWLVETEGLPGGINILVQVSLNASVESPDVPLRVAQVPSLPRRPWTLLRWILQRHATLTSFTHSTQADRSYVRLGEDPRMPRVCRVVTPFLSQHYYTSELQEQEVYGCYSAPAAGPAPSQVHFLHLWSPGPYHCGSGKMEVSVSLLPPVADSGNHTIVLILSSTASVRWTVVATGVRGQIRVYSPNSVKLQGSQSFDLNMITMVTSDLLNTSELLEWAGQNGFSHVDSYTEADVANRFFIHLRAAEKEASVGTDVNPTVMVQKNQKLMSMETTMAVSCQDGTLLLSVAVDINMLKQVQGLSLRDPACRAELNGSHFLLAVPLASCGTERKEDREMGRVNYTNTVFLWKQKERVNESQSSLHFPVSCNSPLLVQAPGDTALPRVGRTPRAALLHMQLFETQRFERRSVGPCVLTAGHRLYVQVWVNQAVRDAVELHSCAVSPLSDPRAHHSWTLILQSCSAEPSLTLERVTDNPEGRSSGSGESEGSASDGAEWKRERESKGQTRTFKSASPADRWREVRLVRRGKEEERASEHTVRFSFILRPVFNNSIQFLHCGLRVCAPARGPVVRQGCTRGRQIPTLTHTPASSQCEERTLSRPVLLTAPDDKFLSVPTGKLSQKTEVLNQIPALRVAEGLVLVLVFAAFLMGLCLMGALWCIYAHTGARGQDSD